jgi:hypothetical protein
MAKKRGGWQKSEKQWLKKFNSFANPVIVQNDCGSITQVWISPDSFFEFHSCAGCLHDLFVKQRSLDHYSHCWFSLIQ